MTDAPDVLMSGTCLQIDALTVTRESLIAQGVTPAAADELVAFSRLLLARRGLEKYGHHTDACAWRRNAPSGCDCGLTALEMALSRDPR